MKTARTFPRLAAPALLALSLALAGPAQGQTLQLPVAEDAPPPSFERRASPVLALTDEQARGLAAAARYGSLSAEAADDLYLLALSRPAVVLPVLERRLGAALAADPPARREVRQLADLIAYAGDERALAALERLMASGHGPALQGSVGRLLDYADGRINPFLLAYRAVEGGPEVRGEAVAWALERAAHGQGLDQWASAILELSGPAASPAAALADDPLVRQLPGGRSPEGLQSALEEKAATRRN